MHRLLTFAILSAPVFAAGDAALRSGQAKLQLIENGGAKRGSVIFFTLQEINSWAQYEVPQTVPEGIRNQKVTLGNGSGTAYALMDFLKMRHAKGETTNWMISRMIEGERPVTIGIKVQSGNGECKVDLTRVEISGVAANGTVLDFLIKTFFLPLYPAAKINQQFALGYNMERIEIQPSGVRVTMKK